ncbi:uncharacterized protein BDFB_001021, partial [Asbolus verrucosus]
PVTEHMLPRNRPKTKSFFSRLRDRISCLRNRSPVVIENNLTSNRNHFDITNKYANNNVDGEANLIKPEPENEETVIYNKYGIKNEIKPDNLSNEKITDIVRENHKEGKDEGMIPNNLQTQSGDELQSSASDGGNNEREEEERMLAPESDKSKFEDDVCEEEVQTFCEKLVALFGLQILLDPIFVHIMIGLSLAYTTSISFSTFFPLFLRDDLDMTNIEASTCMSVLSFMDFVGRIIVPLMTKRMNITHRTIFIVGSFALAACRSTRAATVINQNLVIAEYSKEAHVSSAVGLNMVSKGVFVLSTGWLLGKYKDSAHNYSGCIHILNVISLSVALSWSTEAMIMKLYKKKRS